MPTETSAVPPSNMARDRDAVLLELIREYLEIRPAQIVAIRRRTVQGRNKHENVVRPGVTA